MSVRKCLLVGDGGTGKTSLARRLATGEFSTGYSATVGCEVHHLTVHSEAFAIKLDFHVWDVSGQTSSGPLLKEILSDAHCAIIVFDVTSRVTFNNVVIWYRDIVEACGPNIPVVIVGNKIDMPARKIKVEAMLRKLPSCIKYYDISVKTKFNVEEPILWITGQLLQSLHTGMIDNPVAFQPAREGFRIRGKKSVQEKATLQEAVPMQLSDGGIDGNLKSDLQEQSKRSTRHRMRKDSNGSASNGILKNSGTQKKVNNKRGKKKDN